MLFLFSTFFFFFALLCSFTAFPEEKVYECKVTSSHLCDGNEVLGHGDMCMSHHLFCTCPPFIMKNWHYISNSTLMLSKENTLESNIHKPNERITAQGHP